MDSLQAIASELSHDVWLKQQGKYVAPNNAKKLKTKLGPDVPKVKAPAEKPSHFVRDERLHSGVRADKALR